MVEAVFFDIDGTLVSFNTHKVPDSAIDSINSLREKGIKVFIASGRQFEAINNLGYLQFDGYITLNGSYCFVGDHHVIHKHVIHKQDIKAIIDYIESKKSFPCMFVAKHHSFTNFLNRDTKEVFDMLNFPTPRVEQDIRKAVDQDIYQMISFHDQEDEAEIMSLLSHCDATRWSPLFTDIIPKGGSKQVGMDKILAYFDIPLENTMSFGDGGNDISMLKHAHIGIAMGNAADDVKSVADYVTSSVDKDGIRNALIHFGVI